jgi:adenine-specific DNA-methyltransferase
MRKPANGYRFPEVTFRDMETKGIILYGEDEKRIVKIKKYLSEYEDSLRSVTVLDGRLGSYDLKRLFGDESSVFTNPKPVELIKPLVSFTTEKDSIVLDFFGGSGTTAQAVLELNNADGGRRRFILVQLPEKTDRTDFPTIADLMKERVRRAIKQLEKVEETKKRKEPELKLGDAGAAPSRPLAEKPDRGFKSLKLQSSNFKAWNATVPKDADNLAKQLEMHVQHIEAGRTQEDILFEILLKSGFPLSTRIESLTLAGKTIYSIAEGAMLTCLEKELTPEVIKEIAARKPERVVCLDAGFAGNDQLKTNAAQTFKAKGVTSFRTV